MASGALSKIVKKPINDIVDFAKSFKDKYNIDAYHGSYQEVALNPQMRMFAGKPEEVLIEEEGAPIKAFVDKDITEGDTTMIQDLGNWFSEEPEVANLFAGERINSQVYPVKLKLENPKVYDGYETLEAEFEDFTRLGLVGQQLAQIQPGAFPTTTIGYQQSAAPASPMASFLGGAAGAGGVLGKLGIFG